MSISLVPLTAAVFTGMFVRSLWEIGSRISLYRKAIRVQGKWSAHDMLENNQNVIDRAHQMLHSQDTEIKRKRWWRALCSDSHVLEVSAVDTTVEQVRKPHTGLLIMDRLNPGFATRIVLYENSDEVSYQHIILGLPRKGEKTIHTLHVFPILPNSKDGLYNRHALCRTT